MTDVYFTCLWAIRPAVNYARLAGMAHECGCLLSIAEPYVVTPDKHVCTRFALHAPSMEHFALFIEKAGESIGLDRWDTITQHDFEHTQPLDLHTLDTDFLVRWMDAMHTYGLHNQSLDNNAAN